MEKRLELPVLYVHQKSGFLFKLIKFELSMVSSHKYYNRKIGYLVRVGDNKPQEVTSQMMEARYYQITQDEIFELGNFLKKNPNTKKLPVKYLEGCFAFGSELSAYKKQTGNLKEELFQITAKSGNIWEPTKKDSLEEMVLPFEVKHSLQMGLAKLKHQKFLNEKWDFHELTGGQSKQILNFHGKPGTGKTMAAKAIAYELNSKVLQVDYAQIESKWVGDTGKNIKQMFETARQHGAIILLDEADSLVSKRQMLDESPSQSFQNMNRNIFMQELDKHEGVVILTTNFYENYDEALLRRINQHVKFVLPDETLRHSLIKKLIPKKVPVKDLNFEKLAQETEGLSGGDLKNLIENSIISSLIGIDNPEEAFLSNEVILLEISKIKESKNQHCGIYKKKEIGIAAKF